MINDKKLSRKEKRELAEQQDRENKEYEARSIASQTKRNLNKVINDFNKKEQELIRKVADAKMNGKNKTYNMFYSALRLANARKEQAIEFLGQIEAMEEMKSIADSSSKMLSSMAEVMKTLGALTLSKEEMRNNQQAFAEAQKTLDRQSDDIQSFLDRMCSYLPDEDDTSTLEVNSPNTYIDSKIQEYISQNQSGDSMFSNVDSAAAKALGEFISST